MLSLLRVAVFGILMYLTRNLDIWVLEKIGLLKPLFKQDRSEYERFVKANTPEARRIVEGYFLSIAFLFLILVGVLLCLPFFLSTIMQEAHIAIIIVLIILSMLGSCGVAAIIVTLLGEWMIQMQHPEIDIVVFRYYNDGRVDYDPQSFDYYKAGLWLYSLGALLYVGVMAYAFS